MRELFISGARAATIVSLSVYNNKGINLLFAGHGGNENEVLVR